MAQNPGETRRLTLALFIYLVNCIQIVITSIEMILNIEFKLIFLNINLYLFILWLNGNYN